MPRLGGSAISVAVGCTVAPGSSLFAGSAPVQADSRAYSRKQAVRDSGSSVTGNIFDSMNCLTNLTSNRLVRDDASDDLARQIEPVQLWQLPDGVGDFFRAHS